MQHLSYRFLVGALVSGALGSGAGCGAISFDHGEPIPLTMLPGDPTGMLGGEVTTPPEPLTLDIDAETQKQGTGPASSARLKSLTFTIKRPVNGTFYFATEVKIYMVSAGLKEVEIARLAPIPNTNTISLKPTPNVELLPYARAGAQIKAKAVGVFPKEDTEYDGWVVINIKI